MKKIFLAVSTCLATLCGCTPQFDFGGIDFTPEIVVEGWIENGGVANVLLSQSMTLDMDTANTSMADIPIRWAKVTVSDGEQEEILTGRMDNSYIPPFVYRGIRIKGECGKTYSLKVEYSGRTLTAETTIPPVTPIENLSVSRTENSDTLYQIKITFSDNPDERNFYKAFTQVIPGDKRFFPAFMGNVSDEVITDHRANIRVNRGTKYTNTGKYTPYFSENDTVIVKLTQLPEDGFRFWSDYENEVMNGKNPLFPSTSNIHSNINGGKGIWCGYGKDMRRVIIKDSIK